MNDMQFGDNQFQSNQIYQAPDEKGMVGFLIRKGIAKDAKTANIILLAFAIVCFAITFWTFPRNEEAAPAPVVEAPIIEEEVEF